MYRVSREFIYSFILENWDNFRGTTHEQADFGNKSY